MTRWLLRRVVQYPMVLLAVYTLSFILLELTPGDPLLGDSERRPDPRVLELRRAKYGLDRPPAERYVSQLIHYCRGDFGLSFRLADQPVAEILAEALPVSLLIGGSALFLATLLGCSAGVLAAVRQNSVYDHLTLVIALLGISLPTFVTGVALSICFCLVLGWFPAAGWGTPAHLVLPAVTLALPMLAYVARLQRSGMLDVLRSDYVRTAAAKGAGPARIVLRHALRNAIFPVISYLGPAAAFALTGSFVVEQVFNVPGIGRYFVNSVLQRDYGIILGTVFVFSAFLCAFNLLVDVLYGVIDPRIRHAR